MVGKEDAGLETVAGSIVPRAEASYMDIRVHLRCITRAICRVEHELGMRATYRGRVHGRLVARVDHVSRRSWPRPGSLKEADDGEVR